MENFRKYFYNNLNEDKTQDIIFFLTRKNIKEEDITNFIKYLKDYSELGHTWSIGFPARNSGVLLTNRIAKSSKPQSEFHRSNMMSSEPVEKMSNLLTKYNIKFSTQFGAMISGSMNSAKYSITKTAGFYF